MWGLVVAIFLSINVWSAETTYHCSHFQKDIDYWQQQYSLLLKEKREVEKELYELKMKQLEKGIKIPKALKNTEIIVEKEPQPLFIIDY